MAWLILNDKIDYPCEWYPTHILTEDKNLIPVFLGAASALEEKAVGIYVRENDYLKLNHKKAYIFIHNPDADKKEFKDIDWNEIQDQKDSLSANRAHIHIWVKNENTVMETVTKEDQGK